MSETSPNRSAEILFVEGPDAGSFMHGQFTSDVLALREGAWQFSAWLDAQGRVRALFQLARLGDERWALLLRGGTSESIRQHLARYVFRSRVRMRSLNDAVIVAGSSMPMFAAAEVDGRLVLGCGDYRMEVGGLVSSGLSWQLAQIEAGWPWLPESALERYTPPSLALHRLGAVALGKGCYPGQEIVARLHYRGGNKRVLCVVALEAEVATGSELREPGSDGDLQVIDIARAGATFCALAVAPARWLDREGADMQLPNGGAIGVQLIDSWPA